MDQEKCNLKIDQDFQKGDIVSPILETSDGYECINFHCEPSDFNCDNSYDILSSSLIKSPLVCELLISHGLLKKGHEDKNPLNCSVSEANICSVEDNSGPPSFLSVFSLQPPSNWNDNIEDYDDDEKGDYKCGWESCDNFFSCRKDLAQHVNNSHINPDENSLFRCLWNGCTRQGKAINAKYRMQIHVRTHTHEKPHGCDVCGKKFSRLENLRIHIRSHTGEKPYVCQVVGCNKAYSNSSDRFKHLKTHQEDKPYICRIEGCDKRYTDPSSLRKHMKSTAHAAENTSKSGVPSPVTENTDVQNDSKDIYSTPLKRSTNISNVHKPYACKVEGCDKRYTDPSSLRKHQRATSHGRDPNVLKGRVRVPRSAQNKNNVIHSQVSSAIKKMKHSESSRNCGKSTKEINLLQKTKCIPQEGKYNKEGARPLDLSFSCTSSDDCSVTS